MARGKRGNHEGSYTRLPSGKWRGRLMFEGRVYSVVAPTKAEARAQLAELIANLHKGVAPPPDANLTLAAYMEWWLQNVVVHRRPQTQATYRNLTQRYILPHLGSIRLQKLTPAHVQGWVTRLKAQQLSASTVTTIHAVLKAALSYAVELEYISRNPVKGSVGSSRDQRKQRALTLQEIKTLLASTEDIRWRALIQTAVTTGLRPSELLGLRWEDLDLEQGRLTVRHQLTADKQLAPLKTHSERSMTLPPSTVLLLRQLRVEQMEWRLLGGERWRGGTFVFTTYEGEALTLNYLQHVMHKLAEQTGLPSFRPYDLRHTAATLMMAAGAPIKAIQERLGHSRASITLDVYSHSLPSMDSEAASRLETLLA